MILNKKEMVKGFSRCNPLHGYNLATPEKESGQKTWEQKRSSHVMTKTQIINSNSHYCYKAEYKEKSSHSLPLVKYKIYTIRSNNEKRENTKETFSGKKEEDFNEWLRTFKFLLKINKEYTVENIHYYAASLLRGQAAKYYDNLENEPKNLEEFEK